MSHFWSLIWQIIVTSEDLSATDSLTGSAACLNTNTITAAGFQCSGTPHIASSSVLVFRRFRIIIVERRWRQPCLVTPQSYFQWLPCYLKNSAPFPPATPQALLARLSPSISPTRFDIDFLLPRRYSPNPKTLPSFIPAFLLVVLRLIYTGAIPRASPAQSSAGF